VRLVPFAWDYSVDLDLMVMGIAMAFVGPTFTMAELRAVYEAAPLRRKLPMGRR
jgi:hypothetical protein